MSEDVLRVIPQDPEKVPLEPARDRALLEFSKMLPQAQETFISVSQEIVFFDQGCAFESVSCHLCGNELDLDWWSEVIEFAFKSNFINRHSTTPCCRKMIDLNNLKYKWPAGFGKFALEARSPGVTQDLDSKAILKLETILCCKLKQTWARY